LGELEKVLQEVTLLGLLTFRTLMQSRQRNTNTDQAKAARR
jgi:hypothetical protein